MKKRLLPLALVLALCLSLLPTTALAVGETVLKDDAGYSYQLSNPVTGSEVLAEGWHFADDSLDLAKNVTLYYVPKGTIVTPVDPVGTPEKKEDHTDYHLTVEEGRKETGDTDATDFKVCYTVDYPIFETMDTGERYLLSIESLGYLDGLTWEGEPTQPIQDHAWMITRSISCTHSSSGGNSSGATTGWYESRLYLYFTDEQAPADSTETPAETETPAAPVNPFTDVAETSPFYNAILWAVDQGVTNGTTATTFSPSNTCSISNILTFLWRANGKPGAADGVADRDSAAAWAAEQGMIEAGADVSAPCTRSMAVTFMWKAAGSPETETEVSFTDVAEDAEYIQAVAWAVDSSVTSGTGDGTTFSPDNTCTRGQIATFLYRAAQ